MAKALDGAHIPRIKSLSANIPDCDPNTLFPDDITAECLTSSILAMKPQSFRVTVNINRNPTLPRWRWISPISTIFRFMKKVTKLCEEGLSPELAFPNLDGA